MSESSAMPSAGAISWTEIPVQDVDRAMKFYKDVFGWEYTIPHSTNPASGEKNAEPDYYMFQKGSTTGSFKKVEPLHHLSPGLHPDNADKKKFAVTVTIIAEGMEETVKAIEKAGGSVYLPKRAIPGENMGYVTYFLDSEKNVMGVWAMN